MMEYGDKLLLWQEIIATAENGDQQYSFQLFSEKIKEIINCSPNLKKVYK